ncbi:heme o synthase [Aquabacter sp. L1I39]|uniref:heme o synthase n=1 Tax=Aquabacter sp. L1I39 TaxID=2820278 RepID=UPI001ADA1284|nr:heme o synthase [Aquabacter sp. L1I39]QTL01762.1 heme o synthase [Aquabacter sp. L1I39]
MSDVSASIDQSNGAAIAPDVGGGLASPGDYVALLKPRVMSLVVFTALVGLVRAPDHVHPVIAFTAILCIAVGAGAAGALNMWWDADIDAVMSRTRKRPIPAGKVTPQEALAFGLTLSAFSVGVLGLLVNALAGALLAFTIFFYVVIYTMWLKRSTPQNIVIGGAAGAFPPMVAWAAASGSVSLESLLLVAIIFFWTPPHFWALALYRADDYARAGVPMLPVTAGPDETRRQILLYTLFLVPLALSPVALGYAGLAYAVVAALTGAGMIWLAVDVYRRRAGAEAVKAAKRLFGFSILYLFLLFATLLVEALVTRI